MRRKSEPQSIWITASRNSRMPIAAILSWIGGALRSGWNTSRSDSTASAATTTPDSSMASQ